MSKYYAKFNELNNQADLLQNIGRTFSTFESRLNSIANSMDVRDSTMASLRMQVRNCGKSLPQLYNNISSGSKTLSEASRLYRVAEKEQYDNFSEIQTKQKEDSRFNSEFLDQAFKFVGKLALPAAITALIGKPIASWLTHGTISKDGFDPKYFVGLGKDILSVAKEAHKVHTLNPNFLSNGSFKYSDFKNLKLIGDSAVNMVDPFASWPKKFQIDFTKSLKKSAGNFTAGGAKTIFAVAGVGLSAASAGISNHKDYKAGDITKDRAIKGTILETGLDVGKGMVVGAVATAVVGTTFAAAPVLAVVAVAAVTVGITYGVDYAFKKLTGKTFTKAVSNFVLDGLEDVGKVVDQADKILPENLKKAVNCSANIIGGPMASKQLYWLIGK